MGRGNGGGKSLVADESASATGMLRSVRRVAWRVSVILCLFVFVIYCLPSPWGPLLGLSGAAAVVIVGGVVVPAVRAARKTSQDKGP